MLANDLESGSVGIIAFVPDLWESYWMPRHYIMRSLSRYLKVLWVSPPLYWRDALHRDSGNPRPTGCNRLSSTFWAYTPEPYLPTVVREGAINNLLVRMRARKIKAVASQMGISRIILYMWRPEFSSYLNYFEPEMVCYHIDDEYSFSEVETPITDRERYLLQRADAVFIHSKTLLHKKGSLNKATYYVPNGVDFDHYQMALHDSLRREREFESISPPIIGYAGHIKTQIDLKLLIHIARTKPDWSIVLVGPVRMTHLDIQDDIHVLRREKNVYFLGAKKPNELPYYIRHFDVCLMCYCQTDYTKYIYPLKLHEYLACGKPIVATPLENLKEFWEVLSFAEEYDDWIDKIEEALCSQDSDMVKKRVAVAAENSWESRAMTILRVIQESVSEGKSAIP